MRVSGFWGRCSGTIATWLALLLLTGAAAHAEDGQPRPFAIEVIDEATGRGVPLVELETVNHVTFVTDSHGLAAIAEPDLMHRNVYFTVRSHGYEFPADGFGFRGRSIKVEPGGKATLKLRRRNLAERLYRVTGAGIYRDTLLLGRQAPIKQPLLYGEVMGCDSVMTAIYRDRIYWFWGDTSRPGHPLAANFHITGATTPLPGQGGLAPTVGIDLEYFLGADGAVRPTAQMPGDGPTWIAAVTVLPDETGRERMYASYVKIRNQLESYRWGFAVWNDQTEQFDEVCRFDRRPPIFLEPQAHTFVLKSDDGTEYVYFANPLPLTRVPANAKAFLDPSQYEGYTCLKPGTRPEDGQVERSSDGKLLYAWKRNTPPLTQKDQAKLVERGVIKADEALVALRDVETGRAVYAHSGSTYWNEYRRRWVMMTVELNGESSLLGDVWYAEADEPTGPWRYARKIVTHDRYSFYNPKHHPFFDEDGGRIIYFEGTYTHTFSGNERPTPRYDYNQMMYRLDLSQDELNLPIAFYDAAGRRDTPFVPREPGLPVEFFAKDRPGPGLVPAVWDGKALKIAAAPDASATFYALPVDAKETDGTALLYEYVHEATDARTYSIRPTIDQAGYRRGEPVCRVWSPK
jgi:hypothetical protein